jgi:hypothetical protein
MKFFYLLNILSSQVAVAVEVKLTPQTMAAAAERADIVQT